MKKSLAIYCIYNKEGRIEEYVKYSIRSMKEVAERIIVVFNGKILKKDRENIVPYVEKVIERNNVGYDAGAYKYVMQNYLSDEEIRELNQLILINDSFYGPFVPWKSIFKTMEERKVDYWGINYRKNSLLEYVQSYMMVLNKRIIQSGDLQSYFSNEILFEDDWNGTCARFEIGLSKFLNEKYTYSTYVDAHNLNLYANSYISVSQFGMPIIKKKCYSDKYLSEDAYATIKWIEKNTNYDVNFILKSIYKKAENEEDYSEFRNRILKSNWKKKQLLMMELPKVTCLQLEEFIKGYNYFYIYGIGWWGKVLFVLTQKYRYKFIGFVISSKKDIEKVYGYPVYEIDELDGNEEIIIGMSKENQNTVEIDLRRDNIFTIW